MRTKTELNQCLYSHNYDVKSWTKWSSHRLVTSTLSSRRVDMSSRCVDLSSRRVDLSTRGAVVSFSQLMWTNHLLAWTCRLVSSCRPFNLPSRRVNSSSRRGTSRHFKYQEDSGTKKHKLHKLKYPCAILPPGTLTLRFTNCGNFDFAKSFLPSDSHANTVISYRFA